MSQILPNLYLAGIREVISECETHEFGITHILNVASEIQSDRSDEYHYKHLGVSDDHPQNDITLIFDECIDWIEQAISNDGVVLIHCWSGVSRSTCVVIAYLVKRHNLSCINAFHKVLANRPIIDPWPKYLEQTQRWAKQFEEI